MVPRKFFRFPSLLLCRFYCSREQLWEYENRQAYWSASLPEYETVALATPALPERVLLIESPS